MGECSEKFDNVTAVSRVPNWHGETHPAVFSVENPKPQVVVLHSDHLELRLLCFEHTEHCRQDCIKFYCDHGPVFRSVGIVERDENLERPESIPLPSNSRANRKSPPSEHYQANDPGVLTAIARTVHNGLSHSRMHIERIEISGFKGISSLEFEPGQLNLITGANNSGKTSLLEAVELAFDPTKVEKYGERVEDLVYEDSVHEDFEEAEISVWYSEDKGTKQRSVRLRPLSAEKIQTGLVESLGSVSIAGWRDRAASQEQTDYDGEPLPELNAAIDSEVRRVLAEHLVDPDASFPDYSAVSINVDGSSYEYIGFADRHPNEVSEIARTATKSVIDSWMNDDNPNLDIGLSELPTPNGLITAVSNNLPRLLHNVRFLTPEPPVVEKITFRTDPVKLTQDDIDLDEQNAAVRLSDIEDYLKEHDLVENLDTLSLDQMVYEEDGEKYQVPYEFTGDGFKTLLGLLWELSGDDDEILLLEEPENHLHPRYIRQLVYWLVGVVEDTETQLFLTTHDLDFIRSFFDFVDEPREEFLSDHFRLLKMDPEMPETYGYDDAREIALDLQIDLRGL